MSKLEELIQQYCPDGVEYIRLGDILSVNRGKRLTKTQLSEDGKYYVYHGSKDTPLGKYSQFNVKGNTTIVVNTGGIGGVKFCDNDFWCSDGSFWIGHSARLNDKYVYYYLSPKESYFASQKRVGGVPTIDRSTVENVEIPVPPLPVQEEIVRILDTFTELQAELQAELQKRKLQYNYYLDNLLNFNRGGYQAEVRWMKLKDVCMKTSNIKWKSTIGRYRYIDLSSVDIQTHSIISAIEIDKMSAPSRAQQIVQEDDVIFATTRPTQMRACIIPSEYNGDICSTGYCVLRVDKKILSPRFLFFSLTVSNFKTYLSNNLTLGNYPSISNSALLEYEVPVPSLADQHKIVSILDRFDRLANDLSSGLPAEMEKRRQQYEYYRDKLLTFKRKGA